MHWETKKIHVTDLLRCTLYCKWSGTTPAISPWYTYKIGQTKKLTCNVVTTEALADLWRTLELRNLFGVVPI